MLVARRGRSVDVSGLGVFPSTARRGTEDG